MIRGYKIRASMKDERILLFSQEGKTRGVKRRKEDQVASGWVFPS